VGRNAMAILQDLLEDHGFTARYASVRRFVLSLRGTSSAEARVVTIAGFVQHAPGADTLSGFFHSTVNGIPATTPRRCRKSFACHVGMTPREYRSRFGPGQGPRSPPTILRGRSP
jgi:hypothetical protein